MSHEVETMAYFGATPWHGLGVKLDALVDGDAMLREAGLDWRVVKAAAFAATGHNGEPNPVSNAHFMIRETDRRILSHRAVTDEYAPLQNADMFAAFPGLKWETAGSLRGGCRVWALAPTEGQFEARSGDKLRPYLLVWNTHDGTGAVRVRFTSVRTVCANTAAMALGERGEAACEVSIRHTGDMDEKIAQAAKVMEQAAASFTQQAELAQALARAPMSQADASAFFAQLLTGDDDLAESAWKFREATGRVASRYGNQTAVLMDLFNSGRGNIGESRWDAFNAVTEYIDHQRSRMGNWRKAASVLTDKGLDSALFGTGQGRKARALRLLVNR